ncbi:MAG: TonB family protein [Rikenellaceae bacterium]|jgi:protein TonB|nr:TonB family protein [Rikenellaceae bacterium]
MEPKKSPKADLENKKGLFLQIGMILSLGLCIALFSYSQKEKTVEKIDMGIAMVEEDLVEITTQDQKPPEPVKQTITVESDIINIVKNDAKIKTDISFNEFSEDEAVVVKKAEVREEATVSDEPFVIVEQMPTFQGGDLNSFRNWVQSRLKYPTIAAENGISGKVTLSFVIEKDGTLTNIQVLQTPDRSLSEEAERVLKTSPKWTPGKQRNMAVRVKYTLPVEFRIQN